jgi:hypothetical protein
VLDTHSFVVNHRVDLLEPLRFVRDPGTVLITPCLLLVCNEVFRGGDDTGVLGSVDGELGGHSIKVVVRGEA